MNRTALKLPARNSNAWPLIGLGIVLLATFASLFWRSVNWDEYWFLSQVNELAQDRLTRPLQTIHTRLFFWLVSLPGSDIDALIAGRVGMYLCLLAIAAAIAGIARHFAGLSAGLFAALAYLSAGYVFQHGYSFRVDPLAAALLMGSLWAMLCTRLDWRWIAGIGLALGLAGMVTIKVVLYAPAFAGIAWLRWSRAGFAPAQLLRLAAIGAVALISFALLYLLHSRGLAHAHEGEASTVLRTSAGFMFKFLSSDYWPMLRKAAATAPVLTLLIVAFPFVLHRLRGSRDEKIALIGLYAPLSTLLFYHNTAAYYYTYMLAPVAAACGVLFPFVIRRFGAATTALVLALNPLVVWLAEPPSALPAQRQLADAAQQLFPRGTPYFDHLAMFPSLAKQNMFMTDWGIDLYRNNELPRLRETMARVAVPLVVEDHPMFTQALRGEKEQFRVYDDADLAALRSNYVAFWGPFWLAGREVAAGADPLRFDLQVPGPYTLHGAPLTIDGVARQPGDVVNLARGQHVIAGDRPASARLLWGKHLSAPDRAPPPQPWFVDF